MDARSISWRDGVVKCRARKMLSAPSNIRQALDGLRPEKYRSVVERPCSARLLAMTTHRTAAGLSSILRAL